jgi:hypothetical protein
VICVPGRFIRECFPEHASGDLLSFQVLVPAASAELVADALKAADKKGLSRENSSGGEGLLPNGRGFSEAVQMAGGGGGSVQEGGIGAEVQGTAVVHQMSPVVTAGIKPAEHSPQGAAAAAAAGAADHKAEPLQPPSSISVQGIQMQVVNEIQVQLELVQMTRKAHSRLGPLQGCLDAFNGWRCCYFTKVGREFTFKRST